MQAPDAVLELLPGAVRRNGRLRRAAEANWDALCACYPTTEAALEAAKLSTAVILPYGFDADNRAANIAGSFEVLKELLEDEAEVLDVITKNPGVLGCQPKGLRGSNAGDIKRAASVASGFSSFLGPARSFLRSQSWWDEKPLADGEEEEDDEDEVLELPPLIVSKGVPPFLYDAYGDYNGVKHLLLTEEGEPWGVWDPEAKVAKKRTFDEDGDLVEET